jgi:carbonic anhydrase
MRKDSLRKSDQDQLTPKDVLSDLQLGNKRYTSGSIHQVEAHSLRAQTTDGQYPKAVILSCIDSRVPVELVFDQHIGDVFVARVAGNFENDDILGSMEYACAVAGSKLIVVLGHAGCGAVKAACDGVELGHITGLLASIQPAVDLTAKSTGKTPTSSDSEFVNTTIENNVRATMQRILEKSSILDDLYQKGSIGLAGGVYQLDSGEVTWLD